MTAFRDALLEGRSAIAPVTGFSTDGCRSTLAAEIVGFEPTDVGPADETAAARSHRRLRARGRAGSRSMTRTQTIDADGEDDLGVVLGTWTAGGQSTQQFLDALFRSGPTGAPALLFDSTVGNSAASLAGLEFKLRGPNVTVSHKEASGLAAIVTAVDHLREGRARARAGRRRRRRLRDVLQGTRSLQRDVRRRAVFARAAPFDDDRGRLRPRRRRVRSVARASGRRDERPHGEILGVSASSAAVPASISWPDRTERARPHDAARARRCRPRSPATSTSSMRRRTRRRFSIATEACALDDAVRRHRAGGHVDQGRARRVRRVGRGVVRGGVSLRTARAGCRRSPGLADAARRGDTGCGSRDTRSTRQDRSCSSTASRAAARCSASSSASPAERARRALVYHDASLGQLPACCRMSP